MDTVNQLLALLRDTWDGVVWPFVSLLLGIAQSGLWGVVITVVLVGIVVWAYQEARR